MSDTNHTHDDCVQCLQKEVRRLQAYLDATTQKVRDTEFELEQKQEESDRAWSALKKIGVLSINLDTDTPTFAVSPCCQAHVEINQDATLNCSQCANGVAGL